jgi:hypothetical protein
MQSATTHPTPQHVVDAIHAVAAHLREIGAAEAVIAPAGGAAFHPVRKADELLQAWQEEHDAVLSILDDALKARQALDLLEEGRESLVGTALLSAHLDQVVRGLKEVLGEEGNAV